MKAIISASRRTDIPRWHLQTTIDHFQNGFIDLVNHYNNQTYTISLKPDDVHSIVWWSKDYSKWIQNADVFKDFKNYFQFTILGYTDPSVQKLLEPGVTITLAERLEQTKTLVSIFSPSQINWRLDPIVTWKERDEGKVMNNLGDFKEISVFMGSIGLKRCTISFNTLYAKSKRRAEKRGVILHDPSIETKRKVAKKIAAMNKRNGLETYSCANDDIVDGRLVQKSHCIDGELLEKLFGERASKAKDQGQRLQCGCTKSTDIGSYDQKCHHSCMYCYSNPSL